MFIYRAAAYVALHPPPPTPHPTDLALSCGALQRNDIAMAITKFDQFDFLIDIVPRDDLKPPKRQVRELPQVCRGR